MNEASHNNLYEHFHYLLHKVSVQVSSGTSSIADLKARYDEIDSLRLYFNVRLGQHSAEFKLAHALATLTNLLPVRLEDSRIPVASYSERHPVLALWLHRAEKYQAQLSEK